METNQSESIGAFESMVEGKKPSATLMIQVILQKSEKS
jgi:hypothetical protein